MCACVRVCVCVCVCVFVVVVVVAFLFVCLYNTLCKLFWYDYALRVYRISYLG